MLTAPPDLPPGHPLWSPIRRNLGRPPVWECPETIAGADVRLERLNLGNCALLPPLFAADESPFIDGRFTDQAVLYEYTAGLLAVSAYSRKRGAADYVIYLRDGTGERVAGVAHIYALRERRGRLNPPPQIGLQLTSGLRRRGVGTQALKLVESLVSLVRPASDRIRVRIRRDNAPSLAFFRGLGYREPSAGNRRGAPIVSLEKGLGE